MFEKLLKILLSSAVLLGASSYAGDSKEIRERLNKIFYWQIADDLKLTPHAEKSMVTIIDEIQKRREAALNDRDHSLEDLRKYEKKMTAKVAEPILARYQAALSTLGGLDGEEHKRLLEVLGVESLAKFYLVREAVTKRIRDALRNAESAPQLSK